MSKNIVKHTNAYVGEVYGNILDQYSNPTYNLKLFVIRNPEEYDDVYGGLDTTEIDPRDVVVLAQTGVTGNMLDNFTIEQLCSPGQKTTTGFSFTIKQPGAASFLDQFALARAYLGQEEISMPLVFIDVTFKGYEASIDDEDDGGAPVTIAGPYRYRMRLTDVEIEVNQDGSQYQFKALPDSTTAFASGIFQIPQTFKTVGDTITTHLKKLEEQINAYHKEVHKVPDQIEFDLSELIGVDSGSGGGDSLEKITDESLLTSKDASAETANRIRNEIWKAKTNIDRAASIGDAPKIAGQEAERVYNEDQLMHDKGTSLDRILITILSMCPEFYNKVTRKLDPLDPKSEVNTKQAFVSWCKLLPRVENLGYDSDRKVFAKKYVFTPVLYKTSRPDVAVDEKELDVSEDDAVSRIQQLKDSQTLYKAYEYIFTGRNDQILALDIRYNPGINILLPAKGGALGDLNVTAGPAISNQLDATKGVDVVSQSADLLDKQKAKQVESTIGDLIDSIKGLKDSISSVSSFVDGIGLDVSNAAGFLENTTQRQAELLQETLGTRALADADFKLDIDTTFTRTTEDSDTLTDIGGNDYSPELSGLIYSADILNPATIGSSFSSELLDKGYVTSEDVRAPVSQSRSRQIDITNDAQSATYKAGSVRNKLFGFLTNQNLSDNFLLNIQLQLRGDPWYMGGSQFVKSNPEQANYLRGENNFWLEVRSPITYDPDPTDEDGALNSGYWNYDGVSQTFTAIYTVRKTVCNFVNGEFTIDVEAYRGQVDASNTPKISTNASQELPTNTTTESTPSQTEDPDSISDPGGA